MSVRRAAPVLLLTAAALLCGGCSGDPEVATDEASSTAPSGDAATCAYPVDTGVPPAKDVSPPPEAPTATGQVDVTIATNRGDLPATLNADAAPCTVNSFLSLAEQGYYDDTPCHRLTTDGFSILQCGDPTGTGSGGPGYSFADELTGSEQYPAGTLAMANAGPDTNGSQFFVVYDDTPLGPNYTVFGVVDPAGLKVIKQVAESGTDQAFGPTDGHPRTEVTITSVTAD